MGDFDTRGYTGTLLIGIVGLAIIGGAVGFAYMTNPSTAALGDESDRIGSVSGTQHPAPELTVVFDESATDVTHVVLVGPNGVETDSKQVEVPTTGHTLSAEHETGAYTLVLAKDGEILERVEVELGNRVPM